MADGFAMWADGFPMRAAAAPPEDPYMYILLLLQLPLVCLVVSCTSTFILVCRHLRHEGPRGACIYTVRILIMVPVYSITAFIPLPGKWRHENGILEIFRKTYECIVIFSFAQLLVAHLGGFTEIGRRLTTEDCVHVPPVRWLFDRYSWTPATRFVRRSLFSILQYVFVTLPVVVLGLLCSVVALVASRDDDYPLLQKGLNLFVGLLTGASQGVAIYGLVVFYHANQEGLAHIRPVQKLISIKLLVFLEFWQDLALHNLNERFHIFKAWVPGWSGYDEEALTDAISNVLILYEMFLLSTYHHIAYSPDKAFMLRFGEATSFVYSTASVDHAHRHSSFATGGAGQSQSSSYSAQTASNSTAAVPSFHNPPQRGSSRTFRCTTEAGIQLSYGPDGVVALVSFPEGSAVSAGVPAVLPGSLSTPVSLSLPVAAARGAATEAIEAANAAGFGPSFDPTAWFGSDRWGQHVKGKQKQLTGWCHGGFPMTQRFLGVLNFTDIPVFYRDLRKDYRTESTDFLSENLTVTNVGRYAANFFRGRGDQDVASDEPTSVPSHE